MKNIITLPRDTNSILSKFSLNFFKGLYKLYYYNIIIVMHASYYNDAILHDYEKSLYLYCIS